MSDRDFEKMTVFSSGFSWKARELRFIREVDSITEVVFDGVSEKAGSVLTFRGLNGGPLRSAVELYLGFDDFVILDRVKVDPQREVGRYEVHIFRSDERFVVAFDSYEISETEESNQSLETRPTCRPVSA